ncbi:hypothetical protein [Rhizobium leguminosarum]|uniref:Uncharacterized protein n=1 Tax=Rhizobium leguminosarum TaxID=384 RepID=A0A7W9ZTY0_RHILE|nr:hypothetical protein [Rhizobium leguminosarum]MBB6222771.1 hypothetical protein [Rhizobium leguminosarum]
MLEARQYIVIRYKSMDENTETKMSREDASLDRLSAAHLFNFGTIRALRIASGRGE